MKMRGVFNLFLLASLLLGGINCQSPSSKPIMVQNGFYHWKSYLEIDSTASAYLSHLQSQKLYLRFFDIDWDDTRRMAVPLAVLSLAHPIPDSLQVIPTIFITNRCMLQLPPEALPELAQNIAQKLSSLWKGFPRHTLKEFQLDCDWSGKSRANYFRLLELLASELGDSVQLSATIRLHQIKYARQTGIPPVARGMLMFYNTGEVDQWPTENSILDLRTAQAYLGPLPKYPLPLDIALPLFRWGIVFRDDDLLHLVNGLDVNALVDTSRFRSLSAQRYEVVRNTYLNGHYLYRGDRIRLESIAEQDLLEAAELLKKNRANAPFSVVFYHLDAMMLSPYPPTLLEEVLRRME